MTTVRRTDETYGDPPHALDSDCTCDECETYWAALFLDACERQAIADDVSQGLREAGLL